MVSCPRAGTFCPLSWPGAIWLSLALAIVSAGCGKNAGDEPDSTSKTELVKEQAKGGSEASGAEKKEAPKRRESAISVSVSPVLRTSLVVPVVAEGAVRARRDAEIKFELAGRLAAVEVREGQRVRKGQVLARLDDREYVVALEEAHANYLQGLGKLAVEGDDLSTQPQAQRELEERLAELEQMVRRGEITRDEAREREIRLGVDAVKEGTYRRELLEVRTGLASARAAEARAELDLERTVLRAPFAGVVSGLDLAPGERVQAGQLLCTVVDDREVEAELGVLESDLKDLEIGRAVLLTIPALDRTYRAQVDVISPAIDPESRTCQVLIRLDSDGGRIKPGMFARAAISGETFQDRLVVPREAILSRDGRPLVFRVEGDRAKWVYVELGERNDNAVEIVRALQGGKLEAGDLVVVDNHLTLTHDAKVMIRRTVELDDPWTTSPVAATP